MSLTDSNYQKFRSHLKWAEDGSEAAMAAQKAFDDMLANSELEAAETPEDVLRAYGKMIMKGASSCVWLEPFSYHGKICLYVRGLVENIFEFAGLPSLARTGASHLSLEEMLKNDPELLSHLVPLEGDRGGTRISNEHPAFRYIVEGMGFDLKDVYVYDEYTGITHLSGMASEELGGAKSIANTWESEYQKGEVKAIKNLVRQQLTFDYGIISQKTVDDFLTEYRKYIEEGDDVAELRPSLKGYEDVLEENYMPYLRSKMVVDQLVPKGLKEDYQKYCEELKSVFIQRIRNSEWLSEGSKRNAQEKLNAMIFNVCYPDHWINEGLPDFSNSKSLLEDVYIFRKARLALLKAIIGKSRTEETFTAVVMSKKYHLGIENATYHINFNSMTILPYYMMPPFYDPTQSMAINYESFNTIGHEMTHGFDTIGSLFDKNGDYMEEGIWASAADKTEFDRRTELLVKWYCSLDLLPDELPGVKANGSYTCAEDIADLGGTEIAWQAYLNRLQADGFTGDQLKLMKQRYFLAYAEEYRSKYNAEYVNKYAYGAYSRVHSFNKERVNGVVANVDGWYDAFDITDGALYRKPADRVKIW